MKVSQCLFSKLPTYFIGTLKYDWVNFFKAWKKGSIENTINSNSSG